jgi:hypothetical protein
VPVTAKLSKAFYDRLGEEVADELVEWFNQVDATYRADLRALNELNFARFDAKLEQRLAELRAELNAKIDRVAAQLDAKIDRVAAELRAELKATLEQRLGEQTRWLFVAWASLLVPIIIVLLRK